jgi:iron complex outermembrane receptor protein
MYQSCVLPRRAATVLACALALVGVSIGHEATAQSSAKTEPLPPVVVESTTPKAGPKKPKSANKKPATTTAEPTNAAPKTGGIQSGATALGTYNPALDLPGLKLPPGTTVTTAGPVYGYEALSAFSSTKTATPIEQIPQSIQVIPKSVIEDQRNLTVSESLHNASNVQGVNDLSIGNTDLQPLKLRGFSAEQWLDGLPVNYDAGYRDAFANVERIEVLKGPSAILYGGGPGAPVGGAVNVISKLPTNVAGGEFGFIFGSDSYLRPYFDINQPIATDGTVLFRLTGEYTSADSFVDVLDQDSYSINPTLTLTNKTDTTLTIQGRKSRTMQQAYQGLPAVGTVAGDFRIDRDLYIGPADIPKSTTEVESVTTTLDHRINSIWSFNVKGRWSRSSFDQNSQTTFTASPDLAILGMPSTWSLTNVELAQEQEEFTINPNLQARFGVGPTRNTLLFGADYSHVTDKGHMFADSLGLFTFASCLQSPPAADPFCILSTPNPFPGVDLTNPSFPITYSDPREGVGEFFSYFNFDNTYETKGGYVQLQSTVYDSIHLLAGARLANIDIDYFEKSLYDSNGFPLPPAHFTTDTTKVLPRVGAVVDLTSDISVYASYSEGMRWVGFSQSVSQPLPEESQQREAGIKFNFDHKLSGTMAVFEIDRSNVPALSGPGVSVLTDQKARGFETDLIWQPNRNWSFLASYGYTHAEFAGDFYDVGSGTIVREGTPLPSVPAHSGRLWANYAFDGQLKGFSAGAGLYASSGAYVDNANFYETGAYYTVDAKVGYENERFAASFNVKNLTDQEYFVPYAWLGGQVAPGADRAYYGTVVYKY